VPDEVRHLESRTSFRYGCIDVPAKFLDMVLRPASREPAVASVAPETPLAAPGVRLVGD
jgi:hypothetical protein